MPSPVSAELDRWFELRTKTIINSSLSIAEAYVRENARNLQGTTLSMANDLDNNRTLFNLDRGGFETLMTQQAQGRALAHAALIFADGSVMMQAATNRLTSCDVESPVALVRPSRSPRGSSRKNSIEKRKME